MKVNRVWIYHRPTNFSSLLEQIPYLFTNYLMYWWEQTDWILKQNFHRISILLHTFLSIIIIYCAIDRLFYRSLKNGVYLFPYCPVEPWTHLKFYAFLSTKFVLARLNFFNFPAFDGKSLQIYFNTIHLSEKDFSKNSSEIYDTYKTFLKLF